MRKIRHKQLPLMEPTSNHPMEVELDAISNIIDETPILSEYVLQDLNGTKKHNVGAKGMTAEQVLRSAIVMKLYDCTYEQLAFHISDSRSLRRFCRIGIADNGFKKSALNKNIKSISPETWELIIRASLRKAKDTNIEKGRTVRIDCTVVESNIHKPYDSTQLFDCVRVLTRLMKKAKDDFGVGVPFCDHQRRAKRRMIAIQYAKGKKQRLAPYKDLLKVTEKTIGYAENVASTLRTNSAFEIQAMGLSHEITHFIGLSLQVCNQARRRVIKGESVPANEKVVSIFEDHTDIIIKDRRDTHYGHKICLTGGASNLILDCVILEGNPADTELVEKMLERQNDIYRRVPLKAAFDGGFASKGNLVSAKSMGVKDVCFAKKRGLHQADMCRSAYVYKKLRCFRAGIESGISWLKRSFGLTRCTWKGFRSFKCYVLASVVAANLLTMARIRLAEA